MFNATIKGLLEKRTRLDAQVIKAQGLTKEEVKEYNLQRSALVKQDKLNAFKASNCTISYKGITLAFNPVKVDGKDAIVWRTVDKNGILVASPDTDNKVTLSLIPCVASDNKQYEWRQSLINKTRNSVLQSFSNIVEGLEWSEFCGKCLSYKTFKTVKAIGALKEI